MAPVRIGGRRRAGFVCKVPPPLCVKAEFDMLDGGEELAGEEDELSSPRGKLLEPRKSEVLLTPQPTKML